MTPDPYRDSEIPLPRLRSISQLWACAAVLAGIGVAALAIDVPLAMAVQGDAAPSFLRKLCGLSEIFGHGLGVLAILAVIAVLDPWHRYALPRIAATALGAGLCANVFKLLISRARPRSVDFGLIDRGIDTFGAWFPLAGNTSAGQGFPSSHMATAAALAVVLAAFYPRGRWFFPVCAALAGMQRVLSEAHFASDVLWGAAIGCIFAPLCVYGSRLSLAFDRLEAHMIERRERRRRSILAVHPPRTRVGAKPAA
jgi:membrane-associated phospholipid phosphatase